MESVSEAPGLKRLLDARLIYDDHPLSNVSATAATGLRVGSWIVDRKASRPPRSASTSWKSRRARGGRVRGTAAAASRRSGLRPGGLVFDLGTVVGRRRAPTMPGAGAGVASVGLLARTGPGRPPPRPRPTRRRVPPSTETPRRPPAPSPATDPTGPTPSPKAASCPLVAGHHQKLR